VEPVSTSPQGEGTTPDYSQRGAGMSALNRSGDPACPQLGRFLHAPSGRGRGPPTPAVSSASPLRAHPRPVGPRPTSTSHSFTPSCVLWTRSRARDTISQQPQIVEPWTVARRQSLLHLHAARRLTFHDGSAGLCRRTGIASIARWCKRYVPWPEVMETIEAMTPNRDRASPISLKQPSPSSSRAGQAVTAAPSHAGGESRKTDAVPADHRLHPAPVPFKLARSTGSPATGSSIWKFRRLPAARETRAGSAGGKWPKF